MVTIDPHQLKVGARYRELHDSDAPLYKAEHIIPDGTGVNVRRDDGKTMWYAAPLFLVEANVDGIMPATDAEFVL